MGKIAASVLLKLFINDNEICTILTPPVAYIIYAELLSSNVNNIQSMIPKDQKTTQFIIYLLYKTYNA